MTIYVITNDYEWNYKYNIKLDLPSFICWCFGEYAWCLSVCMTSTWIILHSHTSWIVITCSPRRLGWGLMYVSNGYQCFGMYMFMYSKVQRGTPHLQPTAELHILTVRNVMIQDNSSSYHALLICPQFDNSCVRWRDVSDDVIIKPI